MSENEFREFLNDIGRRFPDAANSIRKVDAASDFTRVWYDEKFKTVTLHDASSALIALMDETHIGRGERFFQQVLAEVSKVRQRQRDREIRWRQKQEDARRKSELLNTRFGKRLAEVFRKSLELPVKQRRAFIEAEMADDIEDDASAAAYHRCPTCRDTGLVEVWDQQTMVFLLKGGEPEKAPWTVATAKCSCSRGEQVLPKFTMGRMGSQDYFIATSEPDAKAKACEVVEAYRGRSRTVEWEYDNESCRR